MPSPTDPDEQADRPEYRVYRSRKALFRGREPAGRDGLAGLRPDRGPVDQPRRSRRQRRRARRISIPGRPRSTRWRVVRWLVTAVLAWTLLSAIVFLASAQIRQASVGEGALLGGGGFPIGSPNTVLVLGSDVRDERNAEPGAQTSGNGRSDSILLLRIGGGANSRLAIARDTIVDIPGAGRQKINAAYAIGGTALAVETIEQYTGIDVNHVVIVSFEDFPQLIDAMGGITYRGGCVVSEINGGARNGGTTLRLKAGKTHIDGRQALALARTRTNRCDRDENDLTRARRQQKIVAAMKRRLLSPMAFVRLPLISWQVPKALRSDMSGPTLLGLFGALATAGTPQTQVLGTIDGNVPERAKQRAVRRFLAR